MVIIMKKKIALLIMFIFIVSGCNKEKTFNCSLEEKDQSQKVVAKFKNDKLTTLTETYIVKLDKEHIDIAYNSDKEYEKIFKDMDGIDLKVTKDAKSVKMIMSINFDKINSKKIKKQIGENFDAKEIIKLKSTDIKTFKKEYLKGYTCK